MDFPEVEVIAFYANASKIIMVFDKNWNDVTDTYAPPAAQPIYSAAMSTEQMWMPPRQKKYIGGGSYAGASGSAGFALDVSAVPWTMYENYTAISHNGSGGSGMRNMAVSPYGFVAGYSVSGTDDEAVCAITTKAETAGQPASFTAGNGSGGTFKTYGDYLYTVRDNGAGKYLFTSGLLVEQAFTNSIVAGGASCSVAAKSDHSEVYFLVGANLLIRGPDLTTVLATINLAPYGFANGEAIEISPDDKWLLVCGQNSPDTDGRVLLINTKTLAVTVMTVPTTGASNARMTCCAWYPDSDQYIVCGYAGARTHYGKRTSGGWLKNLYADLFGNNGSTFGVAIIPKG
jgi:hypothetical protein